MPCPGRSIDPFCGMAKIVRNKDGSVTYRGERFPGVNKPKQAPPGSPAKKRVLAKAGDKVRVVNFGARGYQDFTQHKDPERRASFRARMGGIKEKGGGRAVDNPLSAAHWARKELW